MDKVLVVIPIDDRQKQMLEKQAKDAEFIYCSGSEVTKEMVQESTIIIGNVSPALLAGTTKLKWMQLNSAGTDGYLVPGVLPEGALLTNATGAYGLALSEHMIAMLLALMKKLPQYYDSQKENQWTDHGSVTSIYGSTCLVVGLGDIGSEVAMRMKALGSYVIGIRRTKAEKPSYVDELYQMDKLEECLSRADIVLTVLPGTKETYHVYNAKTFGLMKKGAFFVNLGRGNAVDSPALIQALESHHLAGAGVDVTEIEPLPADDPLWNTENLLITPHISGAYHLAETLERLVKITASNLEAFYAGKELKNIVDFSTGYRKI